MNEEIEVGMSLVRKLVLFIDLLIKLNYEQTILVKELGGYEEYRQKSYRLLSFIC